MRLLPAQILIALIFCLSISLTTNAQLPFYTDDADTTDKGKFHLEIYNEHDILQRSAYPTKRQNTVVFTLNYGLTKKLELGVNVPFITLNNSPVAARRSINGQGDAQFGFKYKLHEEKEGSRVPALSMVFYVEAPTGSVQKELGSGLYDFYLYGIVQKSLTKKTKLRLNGGVLFSGNATTGLIGVQTDRGRVLTGNASLVRDFTDRLTLGVEVFGAASTAARLDRGQLTSQVGGTYLLTEKLTLSFGLLGGRFSSSPRAGAHLGFAYDF
jgi:hypothetical protein